MPNDLQDQRADVEGELFDPNPEPLPDADLDELVRLYAASSRPWHRGDGTAATYHRGPETLLSTEDDGPTVRASFNANFPSEAVNDAAYAETLDRMVPGLIVELRQRRALLALAIPGAPAPMSDHQLDVIAHGLVDSPAPADGYRSLAEALLGELRFMRAELSAHAIRRKVHVAWPRSSSKVGALCEKLFPALLGRDLATAEAYEGIVCPVCSKLYKKR